ncbi:alpha-amylase family glycosyl hydrolase [Luteolibacter sp. GHJ8]|uniref:1,4-alpha-glucan branching enzyme n=1 Tax=Luteolibacter rhizosphaerae TaxID=2989719 RepID=A0ABT3FYD1_9BACT|nr:alpha-amylase family glycosyl hydrolase [Luteolibacter rhizosphaerae]MCW1912020.1 alpha-amylase family glycosyl hydrolase [Luteolibacter rhizosphaerae]
MGAIPHDRGTDFRVWAPNAAAVHVTGSFNDWADPGLPLAAEGEGIWSASALGVEEGEEYKFRITHGDQVLVKIDPRARVIDPDSHNGVIYRDTFDWEGVEWETPPLNEMVVYELHVGTFGCGKKGGPGTFGEVIRRLPYLKDLGVNVIELMPPTEFPGSTSWGYNPSHPFAVESGYGGPDGLKTLIREAHRQGIAVFLDVVYNHFGPGDLDLWQFDGWSENGMGGIFFYNDWKAETPWGHTRPDYGRHEVRQYLRDNALMWIEEFRADGLRLDAVSYIRRTRGNEHHESVDLPEGWQVLQWINKDLKQHSPRIISVAEDLGNNTALTAWVEEGGAGFDTQWDSSFVHPVRAVLEAPEDDDRDIGALVSAIIPSCEGDSFRRVIYSESHDEVANGHQRLVSEIDPGNPASVWARRRTLQAAGLVLTSPGVPMLFQGQEFLEDGWFDDREALDWEKARRFRGIRLAFRDLIRMRRNLGGITRGLTGQHVDVFHRDAENKVVAWHRWHEGGPRDSTVVILNLSHREHEFYELTLPAAGEWVVRFNADWTGYSSDFGDTDLICVEGREDEVGHPAVIGGLKLPPYALVVLSQD